MAAQTGTAGISTGGDLGQEDLFGTEPHRCRATGRGHSWLELWNRREGMGKAEEGCGFLVCLYFHQRTLGSPGEMVLDPDHPLESFKNDRRPGACHRD